MKQLIEDIQRLQKERDDTYTGMPRELPDDIRTPEFIHLQNVLNDYLRKSLDNNLEGMLYALVDLQYVVLRMTYLHGFFRLSNDFETTRFEIAWNRVVCAKLGGSVRESLTDLVGGEDDV